VRSGWRILVFEQEMRHGHLDYQTLAGSCASDATTMQCLMLRLALLSYDAAEQAVIFELVRAGDTGGEIQCIRVAAVAPIAEL
jgi:hypothetical protein